MLILDIFMKILPKIICGIAALLAFSSCTTNYIAVMQSKSSTLDPEDRSFYLENDTIGIRYAFNEDGSSVRVLVENFLDRPLLLDMHKSALSVNGRTYGYTDGQSTLSGTTRSDGVSVRHGRGISSSTNWGQFEGVIESDEHALYIPPRSYVEKAHFDFAADIVLLFDQFNKQDETHFSDMEGTYVAETEYFNDENSPFRLKSYISYSILDENRIPSSHGTNVQEFHVSTLYRLKSVSPRRRHDLFADRSDVLAASITKGQTAAITVGLVAAAVALVILGVNAEGEPVN